MVPGKFTILEIHGLIPMHLWTALTGFSEPHIDNNKKKTQNWEKAIGVRGGHPGGAGGRNWE